MDDEVAFTDSHTCILMTPGQTITSLFNDSVCYFFVTLGYQLNLSMHWSLVLRKPAFCICENKDADQLRGNREADQRLCFRYTDSTIPRLAKSKISCLEPSSVTVQPGLCQTWSETPKTGFLRTRLIELSLLSIRI